MLWVVLIVGILAGLVAGVVVGKASTSKVVADARGKADGEIKEAQTRAEAAKENAQRTTERADEAEKKLAESQAETASLRTQLAEARDKLSSLVEIKPVAEEKPRAAPDPYAGLPPEIKQWVMLQRSEDLAGLEEKLARDLSAADKTMTAFERGGYKDQAEAKKKEKQVLESKLVAVRARMGVEGIEVGGEDVNASAQDATEKAQKDQNKLPVFMAPAKR